MVNVSFAQSRAQVPTLSETFISVDVETDGPIPGPHSMLSYGAAAFSTEGELLDTVAENLDTLPGANGNPTTMLFRQRNPAAYEATRAEQQDPATSISTSRRWR